MNRDGSDAKSDRQGLWTRPLQVPSRSGNDAQETAILSSIHSVDRNRLKRARVAEEEPEHQPLPSMEPLSLKPVFQLRPLSLERGAIAPGLARPTAPFAKSARKKAYVSAIYYSECFLRDIQPREADLAAFDVQNQYIRWWVQSKKRSSNSSKSSNDSSSKRKRRRLASVMLYPEQKDVRTCPSPDDLSPPSFATWDPEVVNLLKERMVELLQKTGGDTSTTEFTRCLEHLRAAFVSQQQQQLTAADANSTGTWLTLSKPAFSECNGRNEYGEYMYTLGRMSFDMFKPTHLRCSIRAIMNNIRVMDPKSKPSSFPSRLSKQLKEHRGNKANPIRHYDIVVAFTIQANQTRRGTEPSSDTKDFVIPRPIRGLMTNHGYMVEDPDTASRSSIWFSGGSIEVQDEVEDGEIWKQIFDESLVPRRDNKAIANVLAAKLLLGAHTTTSTSSSSSDEEVNSAGEESVPTMSYYFKRPIGGHGEVYCDTLFADETLRITQGHHGSIFVSTRVPTFQEPASLHEKHES